MNNDKAMEKEAKEILLIMSRLKVDNFKPNQLNSAVKAIRNRIKENSK